MPDTTETTRARIDALYAKHFGDTHLGHDTRLHNAVRAFTDDVKALVAPEAKGAEKDAESKPDAPGKTTSA